MLWLKPALTVVTTLAPVVMAMQSQKKKQKEYISDRIYVGFMSGEYDESKARLLCRQHKIRFPPKPKL